jgi:hypothetical protein
MVTWCGHGMLNGQKPWLALIPCNHLSGAQCTRERQGNTGAPGKFKLQAWQLRPVLSSTMCGSARMKAICCSQAMCRSGRLKAICCSQRCMDARLIKVQLQGLEAWAPAVMPAAWTHQELHVFWRQKDPGKFKPQAWQLRPVLSRAQFFDQQWCEPFILLRWCAKLHAPKALVVHKWCVE